MENYELVYMCTFTLDKIEPDEKLTQIPVACRSIQYQIQKHRALSCYKCKQRNLVLFNFT